MLRTDRHKSSGNTQPVVGVASVLDEFGKSNTGDRRSDKKGRDSNMAKEISK